MDDTAGTLKMAPASATGSGIHIPASAIHCRCGAWWTGFNSGHCTACHRTFTGLSAFDAHRTGSHAAGTRHCLDPETLRTEAGEPVLVPANKPWPGWSLPGTWEGPELMRSEPTYDNQEW